MVQFDTLKFRRTLWNYCGQFMWIEKVPIIVAFHFMKRRLKRHGYWQACSTCRGFRVLALAFKDLGPKAKYHKVLKMERSALEQEMTFLGLLILQNKLKPETCQAIDTLTRNKINCIMITGRYFVWLRS